MVHAQHGHGRTRNAVGVILADAAPDWGAWANATSVAVVARTSHLVRVAIPPLGIAPAVDGSFPDVRVIDEREREVPYALDPERAEAAERDVALSDVGYVPARGTQAVLDLGHSDDLVDTIDLVTDIARRGTYFARVDVDASDDRTTWRIVRADALVYRVAEDGGRGSQRVAIAPTRSRWLRVRIRDAHRAFPLVEARVAHTPAREILATLPLAPTASFDRGERAQRWTFAARVALRPAAVTFARTNATFARDVAIDASDDGTTWTTVAQDRIERYADGSEHLSFAFPERTARFVRVTLHDGNDAPLATIMPHLATTVHALVFEAAPSHRYRILSGNAAATEPTYDLGARLAHQTWMATAGRAEATVAYAGFVGPRDLTPTQRFPWLLPSTTIVVALALGGFAFATVRKANAMPE